MSNPPCVESATCPLVKALKDKNTGGPRNELKTFINDLHTRANSVSGDGATPQQMRDFINQLNAELVEIRSALSSSSRLKLKARDAKII